MSRMSLSIHDVENLTFRRDKCELSTGSFVHEICITLKGGDSFTIDLFTSDQNLKPEDTTNAG